MNAVPKLRVAFVNTHPIQYFAPLYAYLNRTGEFAVTALYLSDFSVRGSLDRAFGQAVKWDIDLLSGYDARFIKGAGLRNEPAGFFSIIAPQIWREVSRGGFDALVVHGHTPAAALIAVAAARWTGLPVFARGETHLGLSRGLLKRLVAQAAYESVLPVPQRGSCHRFGKCRVLPGDGHARRAHLFDALYGRQRPLHRRLAIVGRAT